MSQTFVEKCRNHIWNLREIADRLAEIESPNSLMDVLPLIVHVQDSFGGTLESPVSLHYHDEEDGRRVYMIRVTDALLGNEECFPFMAKSADSTVKCGLPSDLRKRLVVLLNRWVRTLEDRMTDLSKVDAAPVMSEEGRRRCYVRDHLWLQWNTNDNLKPAAIRDKWNREHPDERIGLRKSGREVVITALKKARKERDGK